MRNPGSTLEAHSNNLFHHIDKETMYSSGGIANGCT